MAKFTHGVDRFCQIFVILILHFFQLHRLVERHFQLGFLLVVIDSLDEKAVGQHPRRTDTNYDLKYLHVFRVDRHADEENADKHYLHRKHREELPRFGIHFDPRYFVPYKHRDEHEDRHADSAEKAAYRQIHHRFRRPDVRASAHKHQHAKKLAYHRASAEYQKKFQHAHPRVFCKNFHEEKQHSLREKYREKRILFQEIKPKLEPHQRAGEQPVKQGRAHAFVLRRQRAAHRVDVRHACDNAKQYVDENIHHSPSPTFKPTSTENFSSASITTRPSYFPATLSIMDKPSPRPLPFVEASFLPFFFARLDLPA
ncbi:unknown [Ruminococcus sp. CAG:579]|nr:unknown [Ruminococcus sp. CAG:579]